MAAGGWVRGGGDLAHDARHYATGRRIGDWGSAVQCPRIVMARRGKDVGNRSLLDDAAKIHHRDARAEPADHAEIVADEDEDEGEVASLPSTGCP